jgi:pimeloyl-ACP methyl ester carboxylesterase
VFYREAGEPGQPVLLLLHGFANSSHYFRHLMPKLAGRFHLIAPDLPSFGFTTVDEGAGFHYTFAGLTETIAGFVNELSLRRFALYVFDYGAPVGFNLAVANPERISAIIRRTATPTRRASAMLLGRRCALIGGSLHRPFASQSRNVCRSMASARPIFKG